MNKLFKRTILISCLGLVGTGCSVFKTEEKPVDTPTETTTAEETASPIDKLFDEEKPVNKRVSTDDYEYTLKYRHLSPSGVALTTEGYVHTIAYSDSRSSVPSGREISGARELWGDAPAPKEKSKPAKEIIEETVTADAAKGEGETKSVAPEKPKKAAPPAKPKKVATDPRILTAYKRFCDGGVGMTDEDWEILNKRGQNNYPPEIDARKCSTPK